MSTFGRVETNKKVDLFKMTQHADITFTEKYIK